MNNKQLYEFARESNEIEGIYDEVRHHLHATALRAFLDLKKVTIKDLETFVKVIEPTAYLRTTPSHICFIGGHEAMKAPESLEKIQELLENFQRMSAYDVHCQYEMIHPFIDGNGRSGRALWLWMMIKNGYSGKIPFLQMFYYQTLGSYREDIGQILRENEELQLKLDVCEKHKEGLQKTCWEQSKVITRLNKENCRLQELVNQQSETIKKLNQERELLLEATHWKKKR